MFNTTPLTLNVLAAAVWILGGLALLLKAAELMAQAADLNPDQVSGPVLAIVISFGIGSVKAKYLFGKFCRKNLRRIAALPRPRLWQFYRPTFFLFLALMIAAGLTLSSLAEGSYIFLLAVATLDLTISIALLSSCIVFWQEKAFMPYG